MRIYNHGRIEAKAGSGTTSSGNSQTRGSSGGRVALIANGDVKVGDVDVSGEWLSNPGSIFVGGSHLDTILQVHNQKVTFDTQTGYFSIEGGAHGLGTFSEHSYTDDLGQKWDYRVCTFNLVLLTSGELAMWCFGEISLIIKTVAGGDVYLGADFILDGGDASMETGYGGLPVLNQWRDKFRKIKGFRTVVLRLQEIGE